MPSSVVKTLQQLIAIPSVNPAASINSVEGCTEPPFGESRLTDHLQQWASDLGLDWLRQQVHPDRDNLLVVLPGQGTSGESTSGVGASPPLLWEVHQDTVAVEGMTVDPFSGELRDDSGELRDDRDGPRIYPRIYGRGACDVKGGMAAMMTAFQRLAVERPPNCPAIVLAFAINEEFGFSGSRALTKLWQQTGAESPQIVGGTISPQEIFPCPPCGAIVAEPTDLNIVVAHKGVVRWRCHATGQAAHTSDPDRGANAIFALASVTSALAKYHREVAPNLPSHPMCGPATLCVSTFHGGVGVNTVPDQATIEIDRRLSPGEDPQQVVSELAEYIEAHANIGECKIEHDPPFIQSDSLPDTANQPLANWLAGVVRKSNPACEFVGAPYGTDASVIAAAGVPAVVFGPGSIQQAHTADEWIDVGELERAAEIYYEAGLANRAG